MQADGKVVNIGSFSRCFSQLQSSDFGDSAVRGHRSQVCRCFSIGACNLTKSPAVRMTRWAADSLHVLLTKGR